MNINLHIERLVLDGVALERGHEPLLRAAIEAELLRLLSADGVAPGLMSGGAVPRLHAGDIQLTTENNAQHLGQQIARALHGGLSQ
jgi:hypothetical protein